MTTTYLHQIQDLASRIDDACARLFDLFCERRRIVPLAFLMHNWPLAMDNISMVPRLVTTLGELQASYHHSLESDERRLIVDILKDASDLGRRWVPDKVSYF